MENLPTGGNQTSVAAGGHHLNPGVIFKQLMQQRESAIADRRDEEKVKGMSCNDPAEECMHAGMPATQAVSNVPTHRAGASLTWREGGMHQQDSSYSPLQPIQGVSNTGHAHANIQSFNLAHQVCHSDEKMATINSAGVDSKTAQPCRHPANSTKEHDFESVDLAMTFSTDEQKESYISGFKRKFPDDHQAVVGMLSSTQQDQGKNELVQQRTGSNFAESRRALQAVAEALTSTSAGERAPPRGTLRCSIMPHQRLALGWMCKREEGCIPVGGILADDQGLGKTVSAIALMVTRPPRRGQPLSSAQLKPVSNGSNNTRKAVGICTSDTGLILEHRAALSSSSTDTSALFQDTSTKIGLDQAWSSESSPCGNNKMAAENDEEVLDLLAMSDSDSDEADMTGPADERLPVGALHGSRPEGGTLVVCPTAVLSQWASEIEDKVDNAAGMTVTIYHGKDKIRDPEVLSRMGVVLTTYTTMALEAPSKIRQQVPAAAMSQDGLRTRGNDGGPLFRMYWHRVVLDEGHSIKNSRTVVAKAAWHLVARHRWILTGTPLQNSVDDLYSYFRFLRYTPYTDRATFKRQIKDPISLLPTVGYKRLNAVLKGIMLRRTKMTKIDGRPVVDLPSCHHQLIRKTFTLKEKELYDKVQVECTEQFKAMKASGGDAKRNYVNMLLMLLRLRQACNHPQLVTDNIRGTSASHKPTTAQISAAKKLPKQMRQELLTIGCGLTMQCQICGDIPEDVVVSECKHAYCKACIITKMQGQEWENRPLCITCSALIKDETVLHSPASLLEAEMSNEDKIPSFDTGSTSSEFGNVQYVSSAKVDQLMEILNKIRSSQVVQSEALGSAACSQSRHRLPLSGRGKKDKRMAAAFGRISRTAAASHAPQAAPPHKSPPPESGPPGVKTPDKVLVFSQWTSMLDLLEVPLREAGIEFRRLDGTMSVTHRQDAVNDFKNKPNVLVLIASLKAAAVGLNLVAANYVVLLDLWWNPTIEQQAIDRAHRIGQTRKVEVIRITIQGTVEDRILSLQAKKLEMVGAALEEDTPGQSQGGTQCSRLTNQDLEYLFLGSHT